MSSERSTSPIELGRDRLLALVGVAAAAFIAVVVNIIVARHYVRWDVTTGKRYTLSDATLSTLRELPEHVEIWVMMGSADPLQQSVRQLMTAYVAETTKLGLHYIDPDRDTLALEDARKRFRIETGRTADGHVVTDAVIVVAQGDRHWFITPGDLVEVSDADDARVKPRQEQAITAAIRNVLGGGRARLCFTVGHGELALSDGGDQGLGLLKAIVEKDNYEPVTVDTTEPNAMAPFKGCAVVVVAGPRGAFTADEAARLRSYVLEGGNVLAAVGPINAAGETGIAPSGLDEALAPFGIGLEHDVVFERDPARALPETRGVRFFAAVKEHPVTASLVKGPSGRDAPRVLLHFARSLRHVSGQDGSTAAELLVTSDKAFGLTSVAGAAQWADIPDPGERDVPGPLVVAMASERPRSSPSAPRGARAVVIGASSVLAEQNWRAPAPLRGAAFLTENAISWLASRPVILDVPAKPAVPAGIRITDESKREIQRYVLAYMPLAVALMGIAVALRRRSTESADGGRDRRGPGEAGR